MRKSLSKNKESKPLNILFLAHRLDYKGGQERSSSEILSRLSLKGHNVTFVGNDFELRESTRHINFVKVWAPPFGVQLFKNLYFSIIFSIFYLLYRKDHIVITTGVSSWFAHIRIVQFVHHSFHKMVKKGMCRYPNERTFLHKMYQVIFIRITIIFEIIFFRFNDSFIAISDKVKKEILDIYPNSSIDVIHHASDDIKDISFRFNNDNELKLLFVGALERKGIDRVIQILGQLQNQNLTNWKLDILGTGDIRRWENYSEKFGIRNKLSFHGVTPSLEYFKKSDIFLFPSNYEPFGLVVSEAASAMALPIASKECGAMELWNDRPEWLNLSVEDSNDKWVFAITKVLKDQELRKDLTLSAFNSFKRWSWELASVEYEKAFLKHGAGK